MSTKSPSGQPTTPHFESLDAEKLVWRCETGCLDFETTADVEPINGVVGQPVATEALRFGLESGARGLNVFVRGLPGSGRMTLVQQMLRELGPLNRQKYDHCYVHNFSTSDRPRHIRLPAGKARLFKRRMKRFAEYIKDGLEKALETDALSRRREAIKKREQEEIDRITKPFESALSEADLELVSVKNGGAGSAAIFPLVDGEPVSPEEFEELYTAGKVEKARYEQAIEDMRRYQSRVDEVTREVGRAVSRSNEAQRALKEEPARALLGEKVKSLLEEFPNEEVWAFLSEVVEDVIETRLSGVDNEDPIRVYGVNVLVDRKADSKSPVIVETSPTLMNLVGCIDRELNSREGRRTDYSLIRPGSLLRADGGFLVLDARDLLEESGAWKILVRTLRTGLLEIVPPEIGISIFHQSIKPEAIPLQLRVILIGDGPTFKTLDKRPEFGELFKVLADFDSSIPRTPESVLQYAGVLARIIRDEQLPHFERAAVGALAELGSRLAGGRGKLTTQLGRVADVAREAAFLCLREGGKVVARPHVKKAIERTIDRGNLQARQFRELLGRGIFNVETSGRVAGQVNGLAVMRASQISYGLPARITASVGPGDDGILDIEGQAALGGRIHTKGFHILAGLVRNLLRCGHPVMFSASLAFEQSYGGIDGDSASGAEVCCLISALTEVPIDQGIAITGAISQRGQVQVIGGVNEKIEGFFDACADTGLSGSQGVIIPKANVPDLMLRDDVVAACAASEFHIWAVDRIEEALEILTGMPAGRIENGEEPHPGTLLALARARSKEFWEESHSGRDVSESSI